MCSGFFNTGFSIKFQSYEGKTLWIMSKSDAETDESGWNKENVLKLISSMKESVSNEMKTVSYVRAMPSFKWTKVAFPPFSAKDCKKKWEEILHNMRKRRSLTELLSEAEAVIASPFQNPHAPLLPGWPARPDLPFRLYFKKNFEKLKKEEPEMKYGMLLKYTNKKFKTLPEEEKAIYLNQYSELKRTYASRLRQYRLLYDLEIPKRKNEWTAISKKSDCISGEAVEIPPVPPTHGYNLFCSEQSRGSFLPGEYLSCCVKRWRGLTTEEKSVYNTRCRKMNIEYNIKFKAYLSKFSAEDKARIIAKNNLRIPKDTKKPIIEKSERFPSDSEDEDLDYSSSEEEQDRFINLKDDEESEDDEPDAAFDMY